MTRDTTAKPHIRLAEQLVKGAADEWNGADLSAAGSCLSALEASSASLAAAAEILRHSPENPENEMRVTLRKLIAHGRRLERLVDNAAAFLRSLPGSAEAEETAYQQDGSKRHVLIGVEPWGLQG